MLRATILHLMGLGHECRNYRHTGRDYRPTDVAGHVVSGILACNPPADFGALPACKVIFSK